jgi:hypothetical protein
MNMAVGDITAPTPPRTPAETGLSPMVMRGMLVKTMFRQSLETARDLARTLCLPVPVTQELIDEARGQRLLEATGTLHANSGGEMGFRLTDAGRAAAQDALAQSEYFGPMPVPLAAYAEQVRRQSIRNLAITRERLTAAMGHLVLPPALLDHLGPAVGAGRSVLMYGPPGNGKSSISNGIRDAIGGRIYVPRAVEYGGTVISVYDPIVHTAAAAPEDDPTALRRTTRFDARYVLCDRPTVVTGGELSLDMLDLVYNPVSRTYQAPLQLKATGGVFIVDDLGRQAEPPQALVNRWIVPLEEGRDILALQSGEKFEVPFDTLVIFSTNFHPNEIFDGAALRRIFFKIKIEGPSREGFVRIFDLVAARKGLEVCPEAMRHLLEVRYPEIDHAYASYQPIYLVDQILAICAFEGLPPRMRPDLVDRAWANLFVRDEPIAR